MCCNVFNMWPKTALFPCGPETPKVWTPPQASVSQLFLPCSLICLDIYLFGFPTLEIFIKVQPIEPVICPRWTYRHSSSPLGHF